MRTHVTNRLMRSPSTCRVEVPFSARFHFATPGRNPGGTRVEGLRMVRLEPAGMNTRAAFEHRPAMVEQVVEVLSAVPPGVVLDATVGGGGHAAALLDAAPHLRVLGLDRDSDAVAAAKEVLLRFGDRAVVVQARFDRFAEVLEARHVDVLSGALFDLGVSSPQFDRPERGFSYRHPGPLDMRMDSSQPFTAADVVNGWSEAQLADLLRQHGETRFARRIARAVVGARPLSTTSELADVVRDAIPAAARRRGGHPARRVFQAIRVAVNDELSILPGTLDAVLGRLVTGGRAVVLSYHSGEDRIVKDRFGYAATGGCVCPPGLPCVCGAEPTVRLLTRGARRPTPAQVEENYRAESARLRAVEAVGERP